MDINIRPIREEDIERVSHMIVDRMQYENRIEGLEPLEDPQAVRRVYYDDLRKGGFLAFYVVKVGEEIAGSVGVQFVEQKDLDQSHPLYRRLEGRMRFVNKRFVGLGIGNILHELQLEVAWETDERYLYTTAYAPYKHTLKVYRRQGYEPFDAPWSKPDCIMMRKRFR